MPNVCNNLNGAKWSLNTPHHLLNLKALNFMSFTVKISLVL